MDPDPAHRHDPAPPASLLQRAAGRLLEVLGLAWELWGRLVASEQQRQHGFQLRVMGQLRVLGGDHADLLRYCTPRQVLAARPGRATRR